MTNNKNTYNNTEEVMEDWGILITEEISALLAKKRKNASGKLTNSIDFDVMVDEKEGILLEIQYAKEGMYVLDGRKRGNKMPPVDEIAKWIRQKKIPVRIGNKKTGKTTGRTTKLTKYGQEKSLAFAIAKNIAKYGIRPFNFLLPYERAVEGGEMKKEIRLALVQDGYSSLQKPIARFNTAQQKKR
jgi:hypothetical protein